LQPLPAPSSIISLDAATVNIFLAQCLCATDVARNSLMSYADGMCSWQCFYRACVLTCVISCI
jgi:hypothetical protein